MKLEPTETDERINIKFILIYIAFLVIPIFALYKGIQNHSVIAIGAASIAIVGFAFLIILSVRHNKKIDKKGGR